MNDRTSSRPRFRLALPALGRQYRDCGTSDTSGSDGALLSGFKIELQRLQDMIVPLDAVRGDRTLLSVAPGREPR